MMVGTVVRCGPRGGAWLANVSDDATGIDVHMAFHTRKAAKAWVAEDVDEELKWETVAAHRHYYVEWGKAEDVPSTW